MKPRCLGNTLLLGLLLIAALPVEARTMGSGMLGGSAAGLGAPGGSGMNFSPLLGADGHRYDDYEPTGIEPVFPDGLGCTPASAYFGSPVDNGGINFKIPEGTPLRAIAAGEVIAKGQSGHADGNFLWLRFSPEETGQPFWTFAKYQQLVAVPALEIGTRVKVGEVVAFSGGSGVFHLATGYGPSPEFRLGGTYQSMVKGQGAKLDDPMILYVPRLAKPEEAHGLPAGRRRIAVAVAGQEGKVFPPAGKTVWPMTCPR